MSAERKPEKQTEKLKHFGKFVLIGGILVFVAPVAGAVFFTAGGAYYLARSSKSSK